MALDLVVLVVVAEYAELFEVEGAMAGVMVGLSNAVTDAGVLCVADCWFWRVVVAECGGAAVAPWVTWLVNVWEFCGPWCAWSAGGVAVVGSVALGLWWSWAGVVGVGVGVVLEVRWRCWLR